MSISIIKTGGKQYRVKKGDRIRIEKIEGKEGKEVSFDTLLIASEDGKTLEIGRPSLGKKIKGRILRQGKAKKISVIKYKPKIRYRRNVGHRQWFTEVEIL